MFIDKAKIKVIAGRGGDGIVTFRREKFVSHGGPDGGNGGKGGSIYFEATNNASTLSDFRFGKTFKAQSGENGMPKNKYGRGGKDLTLLVPVGTIVFDHETQEVLADFKKVGEKHLIAAGGKGGRGNASFKSSTNQAPRIAENGVKGDEFTLTLELKLLADVGFIGFPNAGKSTLLSVISEARPEIADYPFTTLTPQLGVVRAPNGKTFVASDLPGIIEGASRGRGLGLRFLRHAERCKVLVIMIDGENSDDYRRDYELLQNEIIKYGFGLIKRPQIVTVSKMETQETRDKLAVFQSKLKEKIIGFSSLLHENIDPLLLKISEVLDTAPEVELVDERGESVKYRTYDLTAGAEEDDFVITKESADVFVITGEKVESRFHKYILNTDEAVMALLQYLRVIGVETRLEEMGIKDGDTVRLCDFEFEYYE
ncbi:MAG TPA: GTPase ObgE [Bacilli bacterium]|nr:GTPase ObgE [Bacilli bacterium]